MMVGFVTAQWVIDFYWHVVFLLALHEFLAWLL